MGCMLCPRKCGADRENGEPGFCGMTEELYVARVAPHYWEEPCISGERGSGTVFFSGCNLRCVYCQNQKISAGKAGRVMPIEELAEAFLILQESGCHNINLVTPSHYAPQIAKALQRADLRIPVVYNTSSYEQVETLRMLEGLVDIYLADLKYLSTEPAQKYSKAPDYPEVATAALREMVRQRGNVQYVLDREAGKEKEQDNGKPCFISNALEYTDGALMQQGVIVRHLLLPGQTTEAKKVLRYLYTTYGSRIAISILNQYTPLPHAAAYPELNRKVTEEEYTEVVEYALELGIDHGFLQEGQTASESFIPEFAGDGDFMNKIKRKREEN